jgi:hypothetical protein
VSLTDDQLNGMRRTAAYRRAIWLLRLAFLPWVGCIVVWFLAVIWNIPTGALFAAFWLVGAVLVIAALISLRHAGAPFVRRSLSWRIEDIRVIRTIRSDVLCQSCAPLTDGRPSSTGDGG